MPDKAPELYEKIQRLFEQKFQQDSVIQDLYQLILEGNADYKEAGEFAIRTGELLAQVFETTFSAAELPDGRLYLNIAQRTVDPMLKGNYELVTDVCGQVQEQLNRKAGLGLKAVKPKLNQDRINGILNKISNEPLFDHVSWMLAEPVVNFTQSIVDDAVRENADFQYRAGLHPKIVRISTGNCCKWCDKLTGTYDYNDLPDDIYRRHNYCRCRVEFLPGDGRRQNVHTKKWTEPGQADKIERRKQVTRKKSGLTQEQRVFVAKMEDNPKILGNYTPETLKEKFTELGFESKPLGRGKHKGIPFENGGGYRVNYRGDGYLQYHPEKGSRHNGAYYKLSSAAHGLRRFDLNGDEIS